MGAILEHFINERFVSEKQASKFIRTWKLLPIHDGEKEVGEMMLKNNEIHFALNIKHRRQIGRKDLLKRIFNQLFSENDFLITKMFKGDRYIPLVESFGFKKVNKINEDRTFDYFWMNKEDCRYLK